MDAGDAYANLALNRVLEEFKPGALDRAFATETVYGTLRTLNTLDWVLQKHIRQPLAGQTSWIRNILRLGVYQIMYMDRVPAPAAVNEAAKQARRFGHPGAVSFVNGVLRSVLRSRGEISFPSLEEDPVAHISLKYSHPAWLVKRWLEELGTEETKDLCATNNRPAPHTVRTNTLKTDRDQLAGLLRGEGLEVCPAAHAPEGLIIGGIGRLRGFPPFEKGLFQVQDESSMLVGHALSPAPGSLVLDAASAPGGKATHLAQLMEDRGNIVALDIHTHKIRLIEENCRRLGITCISPREADARKMPEEYAGRVDFALLDAPCTGTGVIRRRPDSRWKKSPEQLPDILALQGEMLASVARCVKPGGVLVYSTCSVLAEENRGQVKAFLGQASDFYLESLEDFLPGSLAGEGSVREGWLQLYPHRHGTDGFFMARMRRKIE